MIARRWEALKNYDQAKKHFNLTITQKIGRIIQKNNILNAVTTIIIDGWNICGEFDEFAFGVDEMGVWVWGWWARVDEFGEFDFNSVSPKGIRIVFLCISLGSKKSLRLRIFHRWGLAPVALRGHGGEVWVNTLCPASHVDGLPWPNK